YGLGVFGCGWRTGTICAAGESRHTIAAICPEPAAKREPVPNSLSLKDLLRLDRQLHRDQSRPLRQLQARDRELGARLQQRAPVGRLLAWLNETAEADSAIQRLSGIESAVGFWLALLALVFGAVTMSGLLMVDRD